jgi:hypothetical protein
VPQQRDPDRRRAEQLGDAFALDRGQQRGRIRPGQDETGGAEINVDGEKQSSWAQWYIGSACTSTSSPLIPPSIAHDTYWAISERLDSMTPLGRDSVPEVYIRRSGSSSAIGTSTADGSPVSIQVSTFSHSPVGVAPDSPIQPRIPPARPAEARAFSAVGASASSVTRPAASESVTM